jgi:NADPH:quinone reductase-like Zn-dependent oxidoreductase
MKAYYLTRFDSPEKAFELRDTERPVPARGQVLIRVKAFGLNFADVMARQGLYKECPPLPCILGYDVEGEIVEAGLDVVDFAPGDSVFALTRFGGYAEYVVADARVVGKISADAPVGTGCSLAVQGVTAYHAAMHVQTMIPGEKVLIHAAAGGLGTCLIQLAKHRGCIVIGVAGGAEKAEYLRSLGVDHIIDHHITDYLDYVKSKLDGVVDVVFDNVGGKSVHLAKSILAPGGRIITLGVAVLSGKKGIVNLLRMAAGFGLFSPISFLRKSQSLIGINMLVLADGNPAALDVAFKQVQRLHEEKILQPHVGKVFPHTKLADAHALLEQRKGIGKIVVQW